MHILVVEDETAIAADLCDFLAARGHVVDAAADGLGALQLALAHHFDAIVLDINLPRLDGLGVCRRLREAGRDTPVLMLTARDTVEEKLDGFAHGADDYLVKPFALRELEARLLALHKRRAGNVTRRRLVAGALEYDGDTLAVRYAGREVRLPPKCLRLLETLMAQPGRVYTRAELELAVWGAQQDTSDALRTQLHTLRRALAAAGGRDPIENVHGLGYRLTEGRPG